MGISSNMHDDKNKVHTYTNDARFCDVYCLQLTET